MRPNATPNTVEGSLGGQVVAMQIDSGSIAHIMSVLTELYSDPALAVIREYSVNARDSHIEAGQTKPVEITLPSSLSKYFKIKDYGVGLSPDDLTQMYSMYGASTKRGTDSQAGMLGLGSKSALAYTNQFTIIAVKNGIKTTVSVRRVEDGTGVMEVLDTASTTESNGVEIVVPARNIDDFTTKSKEFFKYWAPGTVLVDGKAPESILDKCDQITDSIWVRKADAWGNDRDVIVMGSVAYPIKDRLSRHYVTVAFVDIGKVNFTPSREELHYTDLTKNTIKSVAADTVAAIKKVGEKRVADAATHFDAIQAYNNFYNHYGVQILPTYKGVDFANLRWDHAAGGRHWQYTPSRSRNAVKELSWTNSPLSYVEQCVFVEHFPYKVLSSDRKGKMREWARTKGLRYSNIYVYPGAAPHREWVNPVALVNWSEVNKIDLGKTPSAPRARTAGTYDIANANGGFTNKDHIPTDKPIYYFSPTEIDRGNQWYIGQRIQDAYIVCINANRHDKFKRDYPTAKPLKSYFDDELKRITALLNDDDLRYYYFDDNSKEKATILGKAKTKILDPEVAALLTVPAKTATIGEWEKYIASYSGVFGYKPQFPKAGKAGQKGDFTRLANRYPLLHDFFAYSYRSLTPTQAEHAVLYMNAIYSAKEIKP